MAPSLCPTCEVCAETFDSKTHRPLVLPCGHSFCHTCVCKLASKDQDEVLDMSGGSQVEVGALDREASDEEREASNEEVETFDEDGETSNGDGETSDEEGETSDEEGETSDEGRENSDEEAEVSNEEREALERVGRFFDVLVRTLQEEEEEEASEGEEEEAHRGREEVALNEIEETPEGGGGALRSSGGGDILEKKEILNCPNCRKTFNISISSLPVCYQLIPKDDKSDEEDTDDTLSTDEEEFNFCEEHRLRISHWCSVCKCEICSGCFHPGDGSCRIVAVGNVLNDNSDKLSDAFKELSLEYPFVEESLNSRLEDSKKKSEILGKFLESVSDMKKSLEEEQNFLQASLVQISLDKSSIDLKSKEVITKEDKLDAMAGFSRLFKTAENRKKFEDNSSENLCHYAAFFQKEKVDLEQLEHVEQLERYLESSCGPMETRGDWLLTHDIHVHVAHVVLLRDITCTPFQIEIKREDLPLSAGLQQSRSQLLSAGLQQSRSQLLSAMQPQSRSQLLSAMQPQSELETLITTLLISVTEQLSANNQQLSANNQQLSASNQQLSASNQQLSASNQPLSASNQQLSASNQPQSASDQEPGSQQPVPGSTLLSARELLPLFASRARCLALTLLDSFWQSNAGFFPDSDDKLLAVLLAGQHRATLRHFVGCVTQDTLAELATLPLYTLGLHVYSSGFMRSVNKLIRNPVDMLHLCFHRRVRVRELPPLARHTRSCVYTHFVDMACDGDVVWVCDVITRLVPSGWWGHRTQGLTLPRCQLPASGLLALLDNVSGLSLAADVCCQHGGRLSRADRAAVSTRARQLGVSFSWTVSLG